MERRQSVSRSTGLDRNTTDKFYTRKNVVKLCEKQIQKHVNIDHLNDLIIEPSAGDGAFINMIREICDNYVFFDISPENEDIVEMDYLEFELEPEKWKGRIHVVGNPPFGRQASLAIKFIKKSCEFCDTVSFILPRSFKKNSMKRHFPLIFHPVYEINLPKNSFRIDGEKYDVPCVFQIWERRDKNRRKNKKLFPEQAI